MDSFFSESFPLLANFDLGGVGASISMPLGAIAIGVLKRGLVRILPISTKRALLAVALK